MAQAAIAPGQRVLDLATGTGDLALAAAAQGRWSSGWTSRRA